MSGSHHNLGWQHKLTLMGNRLEYFVWINFLHWNCNTWTQKYSNSCNLCDHNYRLYDYLVQSLNFLGFMMGWGLVLVVSCSHKFVNFKKFEMAMMPIWLIEPLVATFTYALAPYFRNLLKLLFQN